MQNANRNEWVDYVKGFGIVLVVYGHISRGLYNSGIISDTKWFHFYRFFNIFLSYAVVLLPFWAFLNEKSASSRSSILYF